MYLLHILQGQLECGIHWTFKEVVIPLLVGHNSWFKKIGFEKSISGAILLYTLNISPASSCTFLWRTEAKLSFSNKF